jgi:glutaredoxin-like YruB-family protein
MSSFLSSKDTSTGGTHRVVVYSTPTCHWCGIAKNYLKSQNVPFRDVDVSRDRIAAREMVRRTRQMGVPVIEIDGESIVGFDQARIDQALGLHLN